MEAVFKAICVTVVAGGVLIAAFYLAYLLLLILVLGGVGFFAYQFFKPKETGINANSFQDD